MTNNVGPAPDEIELSVFGPGDGEAAAIHVGDGSWILVDSCLDAKTNEPASLDYLRSIGVEVGRDVSWLVATHAHDDHVKGLARLVKECRAAKIVVPEASSFEEFLGLSKLDGRLAFYSTRYTVYSEYRTMMNHLRGNQELTRIVRAQAGKELPLGASMRGDRVRIMCLAPSDAAVTMSRRALARLWTVASRSPGGQRVASRDPNTFCAAVVLHIGDIALLLGGDVLVGSANWGWRHIVGSFPYVRSIDGHKVPHHGSDSAYYATVWNDWLMETCISIVTPFRSSGIPDDEDIKNMKKHGVELWQTARSGAIKRPRDVIEAEGKLRSVTSGTVELAGGLMGQVRVRWRNGRVRVEKFGPAFQVA